MRHAAPQTMAQTAPVAQVNAMETRWERPLLADLS